MNPGRLALVILTFALVPAAAGTPRRNPPLQRRDPVARPIVPKPSAPASGSYGAMLGGKNPAAGAFN